MKQTRSFKHRAESVPEARHFVRDALKGAADEVLDAVILMVSELASNCIRHTDRGFDLTIARTGGKIRVEASDCGEDKPTMRIAGPADLSGRGLQIIDMFSDAWGFDERPGDGKTVWFTLAADPIRTRACAHA